jgi:serine/threonine protein kinase
MDPEVPLLQKGTILGGKWEILEAVGSGGVAEVYQARQLNLDREVAVKVLSRRFLASFKGDQEEIQTAVERFHREVMVMARVRHPNVLQVYDHGHETLSEDGKESTFDYIVMEYIPGGAHLRTTMPADGFGQDESGLQQWIVKYFLPVLGGLETVHAKDVIHRDLKPENILLDEGVPKLMDFGMAGGAHWRGLTRSHHIGGTIQYEAPEQFLEMGETDVRADIYSLGKILYEAISGKMTKETAFPFKTARLENPQTPFLRRLDAVIQRATAEERDQRYPTVAALRQDLLGALEELERLRAPEKVPFQWLRGWMIAAAVLLVLGSIGFHLLYHWEQHPATQKLETAAVRERQPEPEPVTVPRPQPPETITGEDGAVLRLIPPGKVMFPVHFVERAGQTVQAEAFYLDATKVTNHQLVEFLNQVLPRIRVEEGVVRAGREVWLFLGEVREGYEPISFREGRFHIVNAALASYPVVRVTAQGAAAYARYYGRRLPTAAEWLLALEQGKKTPSGPQSPPVPSTDGQSMHEKMMGSGQPSGPPSSSEQFFPVTHFAPNAYGIRGLGQNGREWTFNSASQGKKEKEYIVMPAGVPRLGWEGFADVGFRCALDVPQE